MTDLIVKTYKTNWDDASRVWTGPRLPNIKEYNQKKTNKQKTKNKKHKTKQKQKQKPDNHLFIDITRANYIIFMEFL